MCPSDPPSLAEAHVLVVGAGGIGCPAAWGLAMAGVGRLTLIDPDTVEASNLPRQVLFREADLGAAKAPLAATRVRRGAVEVRGVEARLDHTNAEHFLRGVDVVIDATDGAPVKDWLNQLAVRSLVPLVHAAGLRAEARLLTVPAGGRPCLACLFGRLHEETGSCADFGVWNGVVGVVGFLAARAALALLSDPAAEPAGYAVLDFETGRALTLQAAARVDCPVCGEAGALEAYPESAGCEAPLGQSEGLDLREEHCPMNLLRARKALAALGAGAVLEIHLGAEGAASVPEGVRALGHTVLTRESRGAGLFLRVRAGGGDRAASALDDDALQRYARQIVLPELGVEGQARLKQATVLLAGRGVAAEVALTYLRAAGVGRVSLWQGEGATLEASDWIAWAGGFDVPPRLRDAKTPVVALGGSNGTVSATTGWQDAREHDEAPAVIAAAWGALLADAVQRAVVLPDWGGQTFAVGLDGAPS